MELENSLKDLKLEQNGTSPKKHSVMYEELLKKRQTLPVWAKSQEILEAVKNHQIIVLVGETGSGKTTQIPSLLLENNIAKNKKIACTQPRRVAAMSVAMRVAQELDEKLGERVGYTIRFDDTSGPNTMLKYLTDGMLLRESVFDPMLNEYGVIILDEAHERTLCTDILFGLIKALLRKRSDLKLIVMSATLDSVKFSEFFKAPIMNIPDRLFPVDIFYVKEAEEDYVEACVRTVIQIHTTEAPGDILVFLTGEEEIETACRKIKKGIKQFEKEYGPVSCCPIYGSLPMSDQQKIFLPAPGPQYEGGPSGRKVVVATNIAETSLTIDGIVYVVDSGFVKRKVFNPRIRVESLLVTPISKASAKQRAGRAGRTKPGKCYRLYTSESFSTLKEQTEPEILCSNMSSVVLQLLRIGITDLVRFDYMDAPAPETFMRALESLHYLEAIDDSGNITTAGKAMAEFPMDPPLAKMIMESHKYQSSHEILTIASMLSVPNCFLRPPYEKKQAEQAKRSFSIKQSDHLTLMNVYHAFKANNESMEWCRNNYISYKALSEAKKVRKQLLQIIGKLKLPFTSGNVKNASQFMLIRKALLEGYFDQVALLHRNGFYLTAKDSQVLALHPSSAVRSRPKWVVYNEFVLTTRNYIRTVTEVNGEWLLEIAPKYWDPRNFEPDSPVLHSLLKSKEKKKDNSNSNSNISNSGKSE